GGIEALRRPDLRVPEFAIVEALVPGPGHETHEAVLSCDGGLVALLAKRQDLRVTRDRGRSRAARQHDFLSPTGRLILADRRHAWINGGPGVRQRRGHAENDHAEHFHHISGAETLALGPGRKRRSFC